MITNDEFLEFVSQTPNWLKKLNNNKEKFKPIIDHMIGLTYFLPENSGLAQRWWHINNNVFYAPKCKVCNNPVKYDKSKKLYRDYCSVQCIGADREVSKKRIRTSIEHWGVDNPSRNNAIREKVSVNVKNAYRMRGGEIKEKISRTSLRKYGVESPFQSEEVKEKIRKSNKARLGVEYPTQSAEVLHKIRKTNLERYGAEYLTQSEEIRNKIRKIVMDRYDCNNLSNLQNTNQNSNEKQLIDFIREFVNVDCRNKKIIHPYDLDILIPSHNLAIEYCGLYWHSEHYLDRYYHFNKWKMCKDRNIRLITIFENEWMENKDLVKNKISYLLNKVNDRIYARNCIVVDVSTQQKSKFFDQYHIQGDGPSSINYGLECNDELVAVLGFIRNNDGSYTLNRYATSCSVIGGFSKLLNHFERQRHSPKIITFADLRWSNGDLYYKTGFELDKILKPDYCWTNGLKIFHKFNFRHKGLEKKLKNYDPTLSEAENMRNHGFFKIYDAGKLRFVKN